MKKLLSLALVVIMVFTLMISAMAIAPEYKDADDLTVYQEENDVVVLSITDDGTTFRENDATKHSANNRVVTLSDFNLVSANGNVKNSPYGELGWFLEYTGEGTFVGYVEATWKISNTYTDGLIVFDGTKNYVRIGDSSGKAGINQIKLGDVHACTPCQGPACDGIVCGKCIDPDCLISNGCECLQCVLCEGYLECGECEHQAYCTNDVHVGDDVCNDTNCPCDCESGGGLEDPEDDVCKPCSGKGNETSKQGHKNCRELLDPSHPQYMVNCGCTDPDCLVNRGK